MGHYVTGLYALNGFLIGLVALLSIAQVGTSDPGVGTDFALLVLTAVILGGVSFGGGSGHPAGVFVGVFTIALLDAAGILLANVASYWQEVVQGGALRLRSAPIRWRPTGEGERRREPGPGERGVAAASDIRAEERLMEAEVRRAAPVAEGRPVLSCHGLTKYYGVVCAVRNVSLSFSSGEIVCLAGDNGAGKSTLIQMLSGAITPDEGSIEVDGAAVEIQDPGTARALGIATVYQNLGLVPEPGRGRELGPGG